MYRSFLVEKCKSRRLREFHRYFVIRRCKAKPENRARVTHPRLRSSDHRIASKNIADHTIPRARANLTAIDHAAEQIVTAIVADEKARKISFRQYSWPQSVRRRIVLHNEPQGTRKRARGMHGKGVKKMETRRGGKMFGPSCRSPLGK